MNEKNAITPYQAKAIIKAGLEALGLPGHKLTARTVPFPDLARASEIFVRIHEWKPCGAFSQLEAAAHDNGFCLEVD